MKSVIIVTSILFYSHILVAESMTRTQWEYEEMEAARLQAQLREQTKGIVCVDSSSGDATYTLARKENSNDYYFTRLYMGETLELGNDFRCVINKLSALCKGRDVNIEINAGKKVVQISFESNRSSARNTLEMDRNSCKTL
jgi:hypothetical protein